MPKVVVNLLKLDDDIDFLVDLLEKNKEAITSSNHVLATHSIDNEIKYLKDFKKTFDLAIHKKQSDLIKQRIEGNPEACEKVKSAGEKIFATDQFGNIYYPSPFQYSYVELTYGNYKRFQKVRFLGEVGLVILVRFQFENVEHNISPTSLKLLENLDKIKQENNERNSLQESLQILKKVDELCDKAKRGKETPVIDWAYFFKNYFYPSAKWQKSSKELPNFEYKAKFTEKDLDAYLKEISDNKEQIEKVLKNKKLESQADPKKENPSKGSKQDSDIKKVEVKECPDTRKNILQGLEDTFNNLNKDTERQIENWKRRFDPNCILKDIKDCVLPPDLDFCDFVFKDISIPGFYKKLGLLKSAGLGDLYLQIEKKMEDEFGFTYLRQKDKEIKSLEKLLEEEDRLRDTLNSALEDFQLKSLELIQDLSPLEERLSTINANLDIANTIGIQSEIRRLEKQKQTLTTRIQKIRDRLKFLTEQNQSIPDNLRRLNTNYDEHLRKKGELVKDFRDKIAEGKFNERQAKLISEGKNLEAVFLVPNEDEKYSSEAVATTIINAVDSVIPLENLCRLLFQLPFRSINLPPQLPQDFFASFSTRFKDPYFKLSVDFGKLFKNLLISFLFNMLDAILKALCDSVGNIVANSIEGREAFENLGRDAGNIAINELVEVYGTATNKIVSTTVSTLNQDMVSWFIENGQSSSFSEWDLSPDGKSFVIKNPPVFDFSQIQNFLNTQISGFATQAMMDMMGKQEQPEILEESPPEEKSALTAEEAKTEIRCMLSRLMSLLTPTETMQLLTKKPDQNTINIVNQIAAICAPKMSNNYPGDSLAALLGEIGILAGALEVEEKIQDISDLNQNLPIAEKVLCERYDNAEAFRMSLLAQTIDPQLASEILDEINKKQQEEYAYIVDSITQLAEGNILERPQTAKQFYLEAITQTLELQQQGQEPKSLKDLDLQENNPQNKIDLKQILQEKVNETQKSNAMLNSMFEITSESLIRPYKDRFRRDGENYINAISVDVPYEKEVEVRQEVQTPFGTQQIPNMEFLNITNMGYVPTLEITEGTVTILPEKNSKRQEAEQEKATLLNSYENDINNYQYYQQLEENGFEEPQENARRDLEYIKNINLTPTEVNEIRDGSIADIEYKYSNEMSGDKVLLLVSGGSEKFKEFLRTLAEIKVNDVTKTFITSGVVQSNIKMKMLPSYVLPYSKKVGSKTILTNKIFSEDKNEGIILNANDGTLLLSNGYVEDNFIYVLYELSQKNTIKQNKKEVGQKYIDAADSFSEKLQTYVAEDVFNISISSRHKNSPLITNNIQGLLADTDGIEYDSVVSNMVNLESLQCAVRNIGLGEQLPTNLLNILNNETTQQKLKEAIALWKIEFKENIDPQGKISSEFSLKTNGLSFSPVGKYDKFYHNTIHKTSVDNISDSIKAALLEKYNEVLSRYTTFKRLLGVDFESISVETPTSENQFVIQVAQNFSSISNDELYKRIFEGIVNDFVGNLKKSDLLKQDEDSKRKLVEFLDFTREQTEYEKENRLDPNIMDFVELKDYFQELYQIEKEEQLTDEQIRGEKSSENKITKSAKNILLISFIRLCINEYILKNIFIFDILSYDSGFESFNFIVKDIANFIAQESKRVGFVKEIQSQSMKYYDLLVENSKIESKENIDDMMNEWKKTNSLSSTEANPKSVELVRQELSRCLKKFSGLLRCEDRNIEHKDSIVDLLIGSLNTRTCPLVSDDDSKLIYEKDSFIYNNYKEGTLYVEQYVRMPKMTENGKMSLPNRQRTKIEKYENSVIGIKKLYQILNETGMPLDQIYNCDSENNLFEEPFVFGCRLMLITNRQEDVYMSISEYGNRSFSKKEKTGNVLYVENIDSDLDSITLFSNHEISKYETYFDLEKLDKQNLLQSLNDQYYSFYKQTLYPELTKTQNLQVFFKYCFALNELIQIFLSHSFLAHNDQESRFLFEGTKIMIAKMYEANMNSGNANSTIDSLNKMLAEQKRNEDNTGNPLGPALEALKFFYRTPIQILKGQAGIVDPNIALADLIVKGGAMAGNLTGQNIDIPYSLASLALLPFPLFNGVAPPIPPLSSYNIALPLGPIFLALEPLLRDLPYYQNKEKGKLPTGNNRQNNSQNPLFCELSDEENNEE